MEDNMILILELNMRLKMIMTSRWLLGKFRFFEKKFETRLGSKYYSVRIYCVEWNTVLIQVVLKIL